MPHFGQIKICSIYWGRIRWNPLSWGAELKVGTGIIDALRAIEVAWHGQPLLQKIAALDQKPS